MDISRVLIILGVLLVVAGFVWPLATKLGLGRLPGDIVIERENYSFYFPIITGLILSAVLSLVLWVVNR